MTYTDKQINNLSMILKDQLSKLLEEEDSSLTLLAKKTSVPVQTLHNWMNDAEPRSLTQVKKVADYFGVTVDYLCFGESKNSKEGFEDFQEEINAGTYEVILRKINTKRRVK